MENAAIANLLQETADILGLLGESSFRIRSYQNASRVVRNAASQVADLVAKGEDLTQLPGVGKSLAEQMTEMVETGTSHRLEELRRRLPEATLLLLRVPGLGPKKVKRIHDELELGSRADLVAACEQGRVRALAGMGAKTEEMILAAIAG